MKTDELAFQIAGGSVSGGEHRRLGRNNQDAYAWTSSSEALVAIVCDGCGSGAHSEFGARLGARLLADTIARTASCDPTLAPETLLAAARTHALARLAGIVRDLGGPSLQTVREHLLFTVNGALVTRSESVLFSLGDGVLILDEDVFVPTYANNAPPYLAYGLIAEALDDVDLGTCGFDILARKPTEEVAQIVLASDGAIGLARRDDLASLLRGPKLFTNPYLLGRRLAVLQRGKPSLSDDTTLIVLRKERDHASPVGKT